MPVQVATLVLQFLVSMSGVEFVNFLDDHHGSLFELISFNSWTRTVLAVWLVGLDFSLPRAIFVAVWLIPQ